MDKILTKSDFRKLSAAGLLGNYLPSYNLHDVLFGKQAVKGHILTIRSKRKDSPFFVPMVRAENLRLTCSRLELRGAHIKELYVQEIPHRPTCTNRNCQGCGRTMNAEIMRDGNGNPYLIYGRSEDKNLRWDVERGTVAQGASAVSIVRTIAGSECWEAINEIWDRYPDAILEFTSFSMAVGAQRKPWLFWEVRDY